MYSKYIGRVEEEIIIDNFLYVLTICQVVFKAFHMTVHLIYNSYQWCKEGYITSIFHLLFVEPLKTIFKLWDQYLALVPKNLTTEQYFFCFKTLNQVRTTVVWRSNL